ncbi:MAG: Mpo1-like protein [Bacteroidia bacterium]
MRKLEDWLDEYGVSHKNPTNKLIHWVCVPSIVLSIIFLLSSIPVPSFISDINLDWSHVIMMLALIYYMFLSVSLAFGMLLVFALMTTLNSFVVESSNYPIWGIGLTIFVLAWAGQFYGHKIEGKKPSFLKDVQFLMIGPIWLLNFIYKRIGIPV